MAALVRRTGADDRPECDGDARAARHARLTRGADDRCAGRSGATESTTVTLAVEDDDVLGTTSAGIVAGR